MVNWFQKVVGYHFDLYSFSAMDTFRKYKKKVKVVMTPHSAYALGKKAILLLNVFHLVILLNN